jgi:heme exporter protein D
MEPTIVTEIPQITQPPQGRPSLVKIVGIVIGLAVLAGIIILVVNVVHHNNLVNEVKTELIRQNKLIQATAKNGVYPNEIPLGVKSTNNVAIKAAISATGADYCIAGTNKLDKTIVFHMSKSTPLGIPVSGDCTQNATTAPLMPTGFAIASVGAGDISLEWSATPFAASYTAQCSTDKDFVSALATSTASGTQTTLANLDGNTQYYCRVAAINSVGQSLWSPTLPAFTNAISVAPSDLAVATVSTTQLHFSWAPVPGAQSYILQYASDINFTQGVVTVPTTATSGDATNLQDYTAYYFHVKAVTPGFDADRATFSDEILGRTAK